MPFNPYSFTNATLVPADTTSAHSVTTGSINGASPTAVSGNPIDPLVPPAKSAAGPTFISTDTTTGSVVVSTNNVPIDSNNSHGFLNGQPAARTSFNTDGTVTTQQTNSIATGDAGNATFTRYVTMNLNGDIFSNGPIVREFAAGITMPTAPAVKVLDITTSVPYGKTFGGVAPSSVVFTNIDSSGVIITPIPHVTSCEVYIQSTDLTNGGLSLYAHGTLSISA